ncbi:hypothetical protein QQG09_07860 [Melissococcus plutonius]|uniref:Uncharacterized protein n=1 Tax=Melissococcus plutonius TaxID=33970 RepID=A0A2Z5Y1N3_9ENTE|nr:hypothetical protein [Melissococcus plutonius]BAL61792.1 hypothetical protein MPD5_0523 [Melissococcus plutonius DAT561]MCV2498262.1 hypothetical protein [Melissococcus plutonius]MCV2501681.1 hypothetical protein [Melissococcus plutonius]MCV2504627.1 hypothetical protein [Melissococcus plutonius]MCV2506877.1 hypothetical protein [Melissococcus plutonius]
MQDSMIDLTDRTDISKFLTHLTRNTKDATAKENLISILNDKKINASSYCCMFNKELAKLSEEYQKQFSVTCFTETPLDRLKVIVKTLEHNNNRFAPYGLIFMKDVQCLESGFGINPVIYVRHQNRNLTKSFWDQFNHWRNHPNENESFPTFGCLVNHVSLENNFQWEREWRMKGDYYFDYNQIVAIIAPQDEHAAIKKSCIFEFANKLTFIDSEWNTEEILYQLSKKYWYLSEQILSVFKA